MKKLGVIVNPIAGMGGRVGLKGTDGIETLAKARQLGAKPESHRRAVEALKVVSRLKPHIEILTYPAEMGEDECRAAGFDPVVIGAIQSGRTTAKDTQKAAEEMAEAGVALLLFAGGDGTARNVCDAVKEGIPVLGVPSGVKIHSAVYAVTPRSAGEVALWFLEERLRNTRSAEVMDIDENAFRAGTVSAKLYGYLRVPDERTRVQNIKSGAIVPEQQALEGIAEDVIADMANDSYYIIGPGTTTRVIMDRLGLKNTLLGVDVLRNKQLFENDVSESRLEDIIKGGKAKIIVTVIGGQGHIFGRGNQQLSARIIQKIGKANIIVIATKEKLISLAGRPLLVDTGDEELDRELGGYIRVTTGYREYVMQRVGF